VKARLSSGLADCRSPDAGHGRYEAPTTSRKQRRKNFERGVTSDGALESQTETKFLAGRMGPSQAQVPTAQARPGNSPAAAIDS
jgi:hypothetical protein